MALNLPGKFTKVYTDNISIENASIDYIKTPNVDIGTGASLTATDEYLQVGGDYSLTTNTIPFSQWSGSVFSPPYFLPGRLFEISSSGTNTYATALSQSGTASILFTTPSVLGTSASFNHGSATVPLVGTVVTGSIYNPTGSLGTLGGTTLNLEAYVRTTTNIPGGATGSAYYGYIGHTFIIQKSTNAGSSWTNLKSGSINWNYNTSTPVPVNSTNPLILQTTDLSPTTSSLYRVVVSSSVPFGFGYSITNNGASGVGGFIQISEDSYFKVTQNTYNAPALKIQGTTEFLNDIIVRGSASFDGGIIYRATIVSSGSNILGDDQNDTQTLIGNINLNGPVTVNPSYGLTANSITASTISASSGITGSLFGTASWAQSASNALRAISASRADTASFLPVGTYSITSSWAQSASNAINAQTASNIFPAITNNINNYILTATGSGTINGEANLTFDGSLLTVTGTVLTTGAITSSGAISSSAGLLSTTLLTGTITASNISASSNISSSTLRTTSNTAVGGTLSVTGATTLTGALTASNISASNWISGSDLRISNTSTIGGTLNVTGATTLVGALTASIISASSNISSSTLRTTGNTAVGGTLNVTGATTLVGALTASIISASSWISGSDLRISNTSTIGGTLGVTGISTFANHLNSPTFFSGFAGSGWKLDAGTKYSLEVDDLTVRGTMKVYELLISQIRATNGSIFVSNTGKVETATDLGNNTYYLTFDTGSQYGHSFKVGDIIRAQRFNITASTIYQCNLVVAGVPSTQALTASFNGTYGTSSYGIGIYGAGITAITAPTGGMEFVRLGSTVDTNRQGTVYLTADDNNAPFVDVKDGVTSHDGFNSYNTTKVRMGKLDGITSPLFGQLSGYGLWASGSAYLEGTVNATAGKVGGFTITNDAISGTGFFLSGSATGNGFFISASNFNVKADGTITASNATLSGTITANTGAIGGWDITSTAITKSGIELNSNQNYIRLGDITPQTTASSTVSLSFTTAFKAGTTTSGSININGVEFYATSSLTLPPNEPTRIYFYLSPAGSQTEVNNNAFNAVTASLNFSSSITPYNAYLGDITASRTSNALRLQAKTPGTIGNSYYTQPIIPAGSQTNFAGGSSQGTGAYLQYLNNTNLVNLIIGNPTGSRISFINNDLVISASNATLKGDTVEISGSNFHLINGNITASNVRLSGTITASAGLIGGFNTTTTEIKTTGSVTAVDNDTRTSITYPQLSLNNQGKITGSNLVIRTLIPSASTQVSYKLIDTEAGVADFKNIGRPILTQTGNAYVQASATTNNQWATVSESPPCYLLPGENLLLITMQFYGNVSTGSGWTSNIRARHNVRILVAIASGSTNPQLIGTGSYDGQAGRSAVPAAATWWSTGLSNPYYPGDSLYLNNWITGSDPASYTVWQLSQTGFTTQNTSPSGGISVLVSPTSSLGVAIIPTGSRGQYVKFFIQSFVSQSTAGIITPAAYTIFNNVTLTTARGYTAASVGGGTNTSDPNADYGLSLPN